MSHLKPGKEPSSLESSPTGSGPSAEAPVTVWGSLCAFVWTNRWWVIGPLAALLGILVLIAVLSAQNPLPYLYQQ